MLDAECDMQYAICCMFCAIFFLSNYCWGPLARSTFYTSIFMYYYTIRVVHLSCCPTKYRTYMQRPSGDWRRRGCIVVVCVFFFRIHFNMYVLLYCIYCCSFCVIFFCNIHEITPKVFFSICFASWHLFFQPSCGWRGGRGTILGQFWDQFGTIFTICLITIMKII